MEEFMQVNDRTFRVQKLLGKGKGGYSYLVTDGSGCYTLKQIHHEPCDYYSFGDKLGSELRDYGRLRELGILMPQLLEVDMERERILKTYISGSSIYELVLREEMEADYLRQIRAMCEKLYAAGLNIDYFPTNFIVEDGRLYYIDYECNGYMEQWDFEHWGVHYWSKTRLFLEQAAQRGDI